MLEFLARLFGRETTGSKEIAKERLRLVLVHDRASVSPQLLQMLKNDLIKVISRYMEIDTENLEIHLDQTNETVALVASIPVKRMKRVAQNPA